MALALFCCLIGTLSTIALGMWLECRSNRAQRAAVPTPDPPRRLSSPRETSEQFVARIIAEAEANDPADWWKRGEAPAEWPDDGRSDRPGEFC